MDTIETREPETKPKRELVLGVLQDEPVAEEKPAVTEVEKPVGFFGEQLTFRWA